MINRLLTVLILFSIQLSAQEYSWEWAQSTYAEGEKVFYGIRSDLSGNTIIAGTFEREFIEFSRERLQAQSQNKLFLAKYNNNGEYQWAHGIYGRGRVLVSQLETDQEGNIYLLGTFAGRMLKLGQDSLYNHSFNRTDESDATDMLLIKYNPDGNIEWARNIGGSLNDFGERMTINSTGDVFLVFNGEFDIRHPLRDRKKKFQIDFSDVRYPRRHLVCYDKNGQLKWNREVEDLKYNYPKTTQVAADASGNFYVMANYKGEKTELLDNTLFSDDGIEDVFLAKYDQEGNEVWVEHTSGFIKVNAVGLRVDMEGNCYVSGVIPNGHEGEVNWFGLELSGKYSNELFIVKVNTEGKGEWINNYGSELGGYQLHGTDIDSWGNLYILGKHPKGANVNGTVWANAGRYILKVNTEGKVDWAISLNEAMEGLPNYEFRIDRMAVLEEDELIIKGRYARQYCQIGAHRLLKLSIEGEEILIAKLKVAY